MLAVTAIALTACSSTVTGAANPANGLRMDVANSELEIFGAVGGDVDRLVRNSLADLTSFWDEQFPGVFGTDLEPLEGGIYSMDPDDFDPADYPDTLEDDQCLQDLPDSVAGNAYFCAYPGGGDVIVYDRQLLQSLIDDYGPFLPAMVLAHEFGHAVQYRVGTDSDRTIVTETQADCFAGSWSSWVADDNAEHFNVRAPELDRLIQGLVEFRDPIGTDPEDQSAHGSYFDRVSAFQEGFTDGPEACRDNFDDNRVFTQIEGDPEDTNDGNAPYPEALTVADTALTTFFDDVFGAQGEDFEAPELSGYDGASAPDCDGQEVQAQLSFCPADNTVAYDEGDLTERVYEEIGDYAVVTAIGIPYAMSARNQLGLSSEGPEAEASAVCLVGWMTGDFASGDLNAEAAISAGDVDEGVQFLIDEATSREVLPDQGNTGFDLVNNFRQGFVDGPNACNLDG